MNRESYFKELGDYIPSDGLVYVQRAYWLVKEAHRKQSRRLTGERYFEHVRRVSFMAGVTFGYNDAETFALGLLHDVIEDTYVPPSVIVNLFGQSMYKDVLVLSKELPLFDPVSGKLLARAKLSNVDYYGGLAIARDTPRRIKGCDRIDNLQDLAKWEDARRKKYIAETETFVLPIVRATDLRMAGEIVNRLDTVSHAA